jgi:large subunit ribosomal protein L10
MVDKAKKIQVVGELKEAFASAKSVVVAKFTALTIPESDALRKLAKKNGAKVRMTKNRLAQVALKGTSNESISDLFKTQTLISYSDDPLTTAKTLVNFAKTNEKIVVLGGAFEGKFLDLDAITTYANVPSLDESRARIATILNAPAAELVRVLKGYSEMGGATEAAVPAAATQAPTPEAAPAAPEAPAAQ